MTPHEVGELFRVDPHTVNQWARRGKLHPILTPGNTRRYFEAEVRALLAGHPLTADQLAALTSA
jgi:predicted site-specific integrase-resolvase